MHGYKYKYNSTELISILSQQYWKYVYTVYCSFIYIQLDAREAKKNTFVCLRTIEQTFVMDPEVLYI